MKQTLYTVCSNEPLARQVFRMRLLGDTSLSRLRASGRLAELRNTWGLLEYTAS